MVERIVLAFVLCVFATTVLVGQDPGALGIDKRYAVAIVWVVGVAFMIWTKAKHSKQDTTRSR